MTATSDTIAAIQSFIQQVQQAATAANNAAGQAEQGQAMASRVGDARSVAAFGQVHQLISQARQTLAAVVGHANEAIARTKAIEGGG